MNYDQFCNHLWVQVNRNAPGVGYSLEHLREVPFSYADTFMRWRKGLVRIEKVEQNFASAVRNYRPI